MKRQFVITQANTHSPVFIKYVGNLGESMPPVGKTVPNFKMYLTDNNCILVEADGIEEKMINGRMERNVVKTRTLVPLTNAKQIAIGEGISGELEEVK